MANVKRATALCALTSAALLPLAACKENKAPTAAPATVPIATVATTSLENDLAVTAEFRPYQEVDLMAKVAGYVKSIRVDIGDHVRTGQVLAVLEAPEVQSDTARAKAALAAAEANIVTAQAAVQRAQAAANIAKLSFQRIEDVAKRDKGLVPRQEVDVAQSRQMEADAQLASAKSAMQAAHEARSGAQSEFARAQSMQKYLTITAPFDGVVTKRYANTGAMIQAGTSSSTAAMPVVRLAQNNLLRLMLPVPVSDVGDVKNGQAVDVNVVSLHRTLKGKITRSTESVQMSTRTMEAEVDVPNPNGTLVPGMYAEVKLHMAARPGVLSVPVDAVDGIGTTSQQAYVVRDGVVHLTQVKVGMQTASRIEITSGLREGDKVIVGRHTGLAEGQNVDPQPAQYYSAGAQTEAAPSGH